MTHDELKDKIEDIEYWQEQYAGKTFIKALRAVVELHKPFDSQRGMACLECSNQQDMPYPCPTIQAIEKELA